MELVAAPVKSGPDTQTGSQDDTQAAQAATASLAPRIVRGMAWTAAGTWTSRVFVLVTVMVLAGHLDARAFGVLGVATLAANVAFQLNDGGLVDALVWWPARTREAAQVTLFACIVLGLVTGGALAAAAPAIAGVFGAPDAAPLLRVYAIVVLADATAGVYLGALTRELAFRKRFVPDAVPAACGCAVTVALAVAGAGVWSLVLGDLVRGVSQLGVGFLVVGRRMAPRWHRDIAAELWRYGRAALAGSFLEFALQNVDYALVGLLLGPVALGFYTIAFRVAILPFLLVTYVIAGVAFPLYARLVAQGAPVQGLLHATMRACCGLVFVMGAGLAALAPFLEVLGQRWQAAVPVARLLGVYICLRSATFMVSVLLRVVHPRANALLRGAWVALLLALIVTVGRGSITAVAVVQVAVATGMLGAFLVAARQLAGILVAPLLADLLRFAIAALIASAATTVLQRGLATLSHPTSWAALIVLGLTFCAVYGAALALITPGVANVLRTLRTVGA
jgi:O-antigen/teichoic acid export membrane protein